MLRKLIRLPYKKKKTVRQRSTQSSNRKHEEPQGLTFSAKAMKILWRLDHQFHPISTMQFLLSTCTTNMVLGISKS